MKLAIQKTAIKPEIQVVLLGDIAKIVRAINSAGTAIMASATHVNIASSPNGKRALKPIEDCESRKSSNDIISAPNIDTKYWNVPQICGLCATRVPNNKNTKNPMIPNCVPRLTSMNTSSLSNTSDPTIIDITNIELNPCGRISMGSANPSASIISTHLSRSVSNGPNIKSLGKKSESRLIAASAPRPPRNASLRRNSIAAPFPHVVAEHGRPTQQILGEGPRGIPNFWEGSGTGGGGTREIFPAHYLFLTWGISHALAPEDRPGRRSRRAR